MQNESHSLVKQSSLKHLSSSELLNNTRTLAAEERRITLQLIEHLKEIDSRMLYAELGFESLFAFVVRHLGYSEGSAHRRIAAMRLLKEVPEVREKLESGALTLTNAAKIQVALRATEKARFEIKDASNSRLEVALKTEIIEACSNLSQNECDQVLFQKLPGLSEQLPQEKVRRVDTHKTEIKLLVTDDLLEKVQKLNLMLSHTNPGQKILNLFERLVDQELERQEKKRSFKTTPVSHPAAGQFKRVLSGKHGQRSESSPQTIPTFTKAIPVKTRRLIFVRAGSKCEFPNCNSTYQLQIDHRQPRALGGDHSPENLRVLCRVHNFHEARRLLGAEKMNHFTGNQ